MQEQATVSMDNLADAHIAQAMDGLRLLVFDDHEVVIQQAERQVAPLFLIGFGEAPEEPGAVLVPDEEARSLRQGEGAEGQADAGGARTLDGEPPDPAVLLVDPGAGILESEVHFALHAEAPGRLLVLVGHRIFRGQRFEVERSRGHGWNGGQVQIGAPFPGESTLGHLPEGHGRAAHHKGKQHGRDESNAPHQSQDEPKRESMTNMSEVVTVPSPFMSWLQSAGQPKSPSSISRSPMPMTPSLLKSPKHS